MMEMYCLLMSVIGVHESC